MDRQLYIAFATLQSSWCVLVTIIRIGAVEMQIQWKWEDAGKPITPFRHRTTLAIVFLIVFIIFTVIIIIMRST